MVYFDKTKFIKNILGKTNKLYVSIFISLVLTIFVTIIVLSTTLHINFERIEMNKIYDLNIDKLNETIYIKRPKIRD